jgi:hypothetical protein
LRSSEVPVLGVCLGHQGLGHVLKATVTYAPTMMHGRLSPVKHTGEGLFEGIPSLGANRLVLEYDVTDGIVTRHDAKGSFKENGSIFQVLDRELEIRALDSPQDPDHGLIGGFVGYLGYECKADCGATNAHRSDVPDAVQMLADRLIAIDHVRDRTHVFALATGEEPEAQQWLDQAERAVREAIAAPPSELLTTTTTQNPPDEPVIFRPGRGREQYLADIARCQSALGAGESYEVCLTDQIHTNASPDPWQLYRGLRRSNPAPFAAYLKLGEVTIVSSSPERFLSVDRDRRVRARPIKGTAPRSADPVADEATRVELQEDEKTFAEHLMIVDLLRNDLGRVCEGPTSSLLFWSFERILRHPEPVRAPAGRGRRRRRRLISRRGGEGDYALCPAAPIVVRKLLGPMELSGYLIWPGPTVAPCVHLVHRRADIYPEPLRFRPERFLERPAGTYTWILFGGGVRRCLAAPYAQMLMKQVIQTVSSEVDLRTVDPRSEHARKSTMAFVPHRHAWVIAKRRGQFAPPLDRHGREQSESSIHAAR